VRQFIVTAQLGHAYGIGDLISYHNDGKVRTVMGRGRKSLSEYSGKCMDMRGDDLLILATCVVVASMASCRHQNNRICEARLMSALTPAATQMGRHLSSLKERAGVKPERPVVSRLDSRFTGVGYWPRWSCFPG
jgi:hypothetical protein